MSFVSIRSATLLGVQGAPVDIEIHLGMGLPGFTIVGLVQGLSEGIRFGQNAGLNMEDVIEVISKGAAQSWQMENRYKTMIQDKFDFGFAVDWMRKDLGIAMEEAKNNGSDLPITKIIDGYYSDVQKNGGNRFDTSSLITRLKKK